MTAPDTLLSAPMINRATGGLYTDNGNLTSDGAGNAAVTSINVAGTVISKALTVNGINIAAAVQSTGGVSVAGVYSVLNSGAKGDGANDDTATINAAIQLASAGGRVQLPPGIYKISTPLLINHPGITFEGYGKLSIIQPTSNFSGANFILVSANDCSIQNLAIQPASATYSNNSASNAIQITGAQGTYIHNVFCGAINGYGIESLASASQPNYNTYMDTVHLGNSKAGLHIKGVTGSGYNGIHLITNFNCDQIQNGDAFLFEDIYDVQCSNIIGSCTAGNGHALHILGVAGSHYLEDIDLGTYPGPSGGDTVLIESGSNGSAGQVLLNGGIVEGGANGLTMSAGNATIMKNLFIFNNGTYGINITSAVTDVLVDGCVFQANGTAGTSPFTSPKQSYDCTVYITGGVVSVIAVAGTTTNLTSGTFRVPAQQTMIITHTSAPTWVGI